ncbi:HoxN/HupN/NixA family nickel/cobalt transporter [Xanthobacter dioxanivorans]|uniref:Nickel/cobalt efflux system n=1 Tax=Xanthobacter dioxanivorans TaxID=2528964 RepID=A0A974PPD7_9HYPH|nr:HoxN/HupN/NixA family nickel/cobalt transporter [Xanthobacter dioxanivorans]QRG07319.1 HoxN/HupN/NixA family nickel/cobalt transporter [Xanthobacter dioxanivorans]
MKMLRPRMYRLPTTRATAPIGAVATIVLLHVAGWGLLFAIIGTTPIHTATSGPGGLAFSVGLGLTAYLLGVRHAFDADHIAAIDNTTRKLLQEGRQPETVGFWFASGHSTVVLLLTLLLAFGVRALAAPVLDDGSTLHRVTSLIGTLVSGGFLYAIAILNLVVLVELWRAGQGLSSGAPDEAEIERRLTRRGLFSRLIGRVAGVVHRPRHMYAVGLLFGLGFDTATEVALLVLATSGAAGGLPWYAILCLPILFAAGMSLFDTAQGVFMTAAYGWASAHPLRRLHYNLAITGLSVIVALLIGSVEITGLVGERFALHGGAWDVVEALDMNAVGFGIAGLFVTFWLVAALMWASGTSRTHRWRNASRPSNVEAE